MPLRAEVYGSIKRGFVSRKSTENIVARAVLGSAELGPYLSPNQVLNYVEAHDNYNLFDLLQTLHPNEEVAGLVKRSELATAMNLLFQGMTFMQLGQEFMRTKLVATGPDGEITPLDCERAMNSLQCSRFCESGQLGSGQSEQGINCLYPKLDRLEDKSSCLRT